MYQTQRFVNVIASQLFGEYLYRMLALMTAIVFLALSNTSFALAPNRGATCEGIAGASQSSLTNADYTNLVSAVNTDNYVNIAGNSSGAIPLQIKMTISEKNDPPTSGSFNVQTIGSINAFNLVRNFPSVDSVTSVDLDFRNRVTERPIFLTNVALSAFDIDYASISESGFDDYVLFSGVTASGNTINGTYQSLQAAGSNIRPFTDGRPNTSGVGLYTVNTNTNTECPGNNLDTECQGSIQFAEPVSSVKIRYSNANYRTRYTDPTNQQVFFRVDNYCYVPQYIFSGTVFDDNGGIPENRASKDNSDITSPISVYANKPSYFNGTFDKSIEKGIADSSVKLTNCATNPTTIYPTQSVIRDGAPVGEYQISIPKTTLGTDTNLCLLESRTGNTYPIRTSTDSIKVSGFSPTAYNYPNNNFGRVIPANAALVLRKAQFVNDCPSTLDYTASTLNTPGNTNPRTGFSESSISGSELIPGQCIAYRITATNRSNLVINDFVMQDKLQKKGVEGALVTSVLVGPLHNSSDYALNSVAIGQNNPVITKPLVLPDRDNKVFYFNTKYGTTVDP